MDFSMNQNSIDYYKKLGMKNARNEFTAEAVVPDTQEDIARILGSDANVCVHTKNALTGRVSISGDVIAKTAYVPESQNGVCALDYRIPFSVDLEAEGQGEVLPVVSVRLICLDVHMLNPRKILARAELVVEAECYCKDTMSWYDAVDGDKDVFVKMAGKSISLPAFITEKSFNISDEISLPEGKAPPEKLLLSRTCLKADDWSDVGGRLIVRGTAETCVTYLPIDGDKPESVEFNSQFSQLLELPEISMSDFQVSVMLTDAYTDVFTTAGGARAMSVEIHGVAQCVCLQDVNVSYIDDAYCTRGQLDISRTPCMAAYGAYSKIQAVKRERLELRQTAKKIISVNSVCGASTAVDGKLQTPVSVNIMYLGDDEGVFSEQLKMLAEAECEGVVPQCVSATVGNIETLADGDGINAAVTVDFLVGEENVTEFSPVTGLRLEDENLFSDTRPSVTVIRADTDDMWCIAKKYRSCAETIKKCNCLEEGESVSGKILLIPRAKY